MLRVGVIGYGYWGPNLVRNFMEAEGSRVTWVSDLREQRLELARNRHPSLRVTREPKEIWADPEVDAVAIATDIGSHHRLVLEALSAGKHVLVEKPLADSAERAAELVAEAERRGLTLMVDHTFVYTSAVRRIHELIRDGQLGELYYYDSVRVNLGLFQHAHNVIWDLAVHDLAIMDHVLPSRPQAVSACGMSHLEGQPENVAYITLFFPERLIAHVHVNWLAPAKVRSTLVGGSDKMIVYNDLEPSEKVMVYDRGVDLAQNHEAVYQQLLSYRIGDVWAPRLDPTEALQTEARHFIDCVREGRRPLTDGQAGLRVVKLVEAASRSMRERGRLVELA